MSANNVFYKPSFNLESILPETLEGDTEKFLLFLNGYYEWLQTSEIIISNQTGTFVRDEIITGDFTNAIAVVKEVKTSSIVVRMRTNAPFDLLESITGQTSSAIGTISSIKDNVIRKTGQLLNYKDITKTVDKYVDFLKRELYYSLPVDIEANKRLVARKYRNFLQNKGNEESYKYLFRTVYNENIEIKYPSEEVLRVSDGKFEKTQIIRAVIENESTIFDYLNQTISGTTSGTIANVVDIKLINVGSFRVAEMTLKLVSGVFSANERIEIVGSETTNTEIYGMITGFTINDAGSGYSAGNTITITSGNGVEAKAVVSSIQKSPITKLKVNAPGYGYRLNSSASINNSGTGGTGLVVRVTEISNTYSVGGYTVGETATISIINRGSDYFRAPTITLVDSVISSLGLLSENLITIESGGSNYAVGDSLVFTGGSGSSAAGQVASVNESISYDFLFEDGFKMKADGSYYDIIKNEDWNVTGAITRIELTNFGTGYTSTNLPTISVTSGTGSSANLVATNIQGSSANVVVDVANNATGIGSIRKIDLIDFGVNYTSANVNLTGIGDGNANATAVITGLGIKEGVWVNDDGKIDYKILQDSLYYQDFSYVIRSGLQFNEYAALVKEIIHPAGLQFFGEILLISEIDAAPIFTSTIETIANINKYIYYIKTELDASSPGIVPNSDLISREKEYSSFIETQLQIHSAFEQVSILIPFIDVSPIITSAAEIIENINKYILYLKSVASTPSSYRSTKNVIRIENNVGLIDTNFDYFGPSKLLLRDVPISQFSSNTISLLESYTFNDVYGSGMKSIAKNVRITGTVNVTGNNVVGSGTTFTSDFANGDDIIIGDERFIVSNVANSTSIVLNVPASISYSGARAYKEVAVS